MRAHHRRHRDRRHRRDDLPPRSDLEHLQQHRQQPHVIRGCGGRARVGRPPRPVSYAARPAALRSAGMSRSIERIKETWDGRAKDDRLQGTYVTMADRNQRMLEIDEALRYITPGKLVLDVGCGNGYSTAIFAKQAEVILAIDYSEAMIERAKREYGAIPNITFEVQDILKPLPYVGRYCYVAFAHGAFCSFSTWASQLQALWTI